MTATPQHDTASPLPSQTAAGADAADNGQRPARSALEGLASSARNARSQATAALADLAGGAGDLARDSARELSRYSVDARDAMVDSIRQRPLQAMLIAAGAGAAIAIVVRMLFGASRRER
jgi:ElaB/YqjD/DUF883 family membrane-anchored ribosome-binding protein